jgi:hypothetical protein
MLALSVLPMHSHGPRDRPAAYARDGADWQRGGNGVAQLTRLVR